MPSWIDGSLYPDAAVPERLDLLEDRVDFIARLSAAWDFGVLPSREVIAEVTRAEWCASVAACRLLTSPAYHLLRRLHGLPALPFFGSTDPRVSGDENLQFI